MKTILLIIIIAALVLPSIFTISNVNAVCCFPYETTHYIDPVTGYLIVEGQLWNDSYRGEPFGNVNYSFRFFDSERNALFERDLALTNGFPIDDGFVIPPGTVLPFHIVLDDIDDELLSKIFSVHSGVTNTLDYFTWKPVDLKTTFDNLEQVATIHDPITQDPFIKWRVTGTITNTHSEQTQNVHVVASLLQEDGFLGTAGYSEDSVQPLVLDGFETKDFEIYSILPQDKIPDNVRLYAESDESSMIHKRYNPIILKNVIDFEGRHVSDPKIPTIISANVTNISRDNFDLKWLIQIKKSPKSMLDSDMTKYSESKIEFIKEIPVQIDEQQSILLEYPWFPQFGGIYFYEMYLWDDYIPLSYPFTGNFISQGEIFVNPHIFSVKNQINSGVPFDELVCRNDLVLVNKASNANFVCVKPTSVLKLIERDWILE